MGAPARLEPMSAIAQARNGSPPRQPSSAPARRPPHMGVSRGAPPASHRPTCPDRTDPRCARIDLRGRLRGGFGHWRASRFGGALHDDTPAGRARIAEGAWRGRRGRRMNASCRHVRRQRAGGCGVARASRARWKSIGNGRCRRLSSELGSECLPFGSRTPLVVRNSERCTSRIHPAGRAQCRGIVVQAQHAHARPELGRVLRARGLSAAFSRPTFRAHGSAGASSSADMACGGLACFSAAFRRYTPLLLCLCNGALCVPPGVSPQVLSGFPRGGVRTKLLPSRLHQSCSVQLAFLDFWF